MVLHCYRQTHRHMPFGTEVGLDAGVIVLDANPAPPPKKNKERGTAPNFRPMSVLRCHLLSR